MVEPRTHRRLAAILAADVVGYSRMMATDEAGTLAALKRHREAVFDPAVAQHNGRIVKLMGDGTLVEFGSVVDAVNCALSIQRRADTTITLRIGVNLGDIIIDGDDIYGDGVNVAARLEPLAEPGGICVAAIVNDSVGSRVSVKFRDCGEVHVKNIDHPVRIWKWHPTDSSGKVAAPDVPRDSERSTLPSLAVLPFQNMSGDAEQEYFSDGVVEDLITGLSRFKSLTVIARNSSFVYKGRPIDVRQAARELGCRYVVEGSVRRVGQRLRIAAQLIDGASGAHLWAENYQGSVEDVFDVQDRITESIVAVVEPKIQQAEIDRSRRERPESVDVYDLYLRAMAKLDTLHPADSAAGLELLDLVIELDPGFTRAIAMAAWGYEYRIHMGLPPLGPNDEQKCLDLARRVLAVERADATNIAHCGIILQLVAHEFDQGLLTIKRALELNPSNVAVQFFAGVGNLKGGNLDEALGFFHRAIELNPTDSAGGMAGIAHANLLKGNYREALDWAARALVRNPNFGWIHWSVIAAYAYLGRMDEAKRAFAAYSQIFPDATLARIRNGQQTKDPRRVEVLVEGLRLAGMPEA
jgi:TolB-like protein/class 3 adenylate cyclase